MKEMSDPELPLSPPASVAATLQIPGGTFILTHDELDLEAVIWPVQDGTAGAIAAFHWNNTGFLPRCDTTLPFVPCFHESYFGSRVRS